MSLVDAPNSAFEKDILDSFVHTYGSGDHLQYIPTFEPDNDRLAIYRELMRGHSPQPDLYEIDVIWPALLADGLVDLRPYLGSDLEAFPPKLIDAFTIHGKLVAVPLILDTGVLYYRSDLLKKYGFHHPPNTWNELERMAAVIQSGERSSGNKNFWGYIWQGKATEGLTCNALEWQSSEGGGQILRADGRTDVYNNNAVRALQRAVSWIGTISPPEVTTYKEDDSFNFWQSGNAAFMRNWATLYGEAGDASCPIRNRVGVAMLPAGLRGICRVVGGVGIGVSKYSRNRAEAIAAVRQLAGSSVQEARAEVTGSVPTRLDLQQHAELMKNTPFHGRLAGYAMADVVMRPAGVTSTSYDLLSQAYAEAIHSALTRQATPEEALYGLQRRLAAMTSEPSQR